MDIAISIVSTLGPWGLLALLVLLNGCGVVALVLVLYWQPRLVRLLLAAFKDQIDAERMHHANTVKGIGSRMDRMEATNERIEDKVDAVLKCWPRLYEMDPDPGDAAS